MNPYHSLEQVRNILATELETEKGNKLDNFIFQLIQTNLLTPYIEYKGIVEGVTQTMAVTKNKAIKSIATTIEKDIADWKIDEFHLSNKYDANLNIDKTLHSVQKLITSFQDEYASELSGVQTYVHAIFRLSPNNISETALEIEAELGLSKPIAKPIKFIANGTMLTEIDFIGYQLYSLTDEINEQVNLEKKCILNFARKDLDYVVANVKEKRQLTDLESELKQAYRTISELEQKNDDLIYQTQKTTKEPARNNDKNQDQKIIAMMAIMLSNQNKSLKWSDKPNLSAIKKEIEKLVDNLQISNLHTYGLNAPDKRIKECLKDFSQFFYTDSKS